MVVERANLRGRSAAFPALTATLFFVLLGCQGDECAGDEIVYEGGRMVSDREWESSAMDEPWVEFAPRRLVHFPIAAFSNRTIADITPYVSYVPQPNISGDGGVKSSNFSVAVGDMANLYISRGSIEVLNNTCTHLYLRVTARAYP